MAPGQLESRQLEFQNTGKSAIRISAYGIRAYRLLAYGILAYQYQGQLHQENVISTECIKQGLGNAFYLEFSAISACFWHRSARWDVAKWFGFV